MEQLNLLLRTSTALLAIAAIGGIAMGRMGLVQDKKPPNALAMFHGFLAAAAISLLMFAAATIGLPALAFLALILLLLAASGGIYLNLKFHWQQLPLPKWLIIVHAIAAILGFLALLTATWMNPN